MHPQSGEAGGGRFSGVMALEQLPVVCFGGGRSGADQRMGHSEVEDAKTGGVEPMVSAAVVPMSRKARDMGHPRLDGALGRPTRKWETWATRQMSRRSCFVLGISFLYQPLRLKTLCRRTWWSKRSMLYSGRRISHSLTSISREAPSCHKLKAGRLGIM